MMKNACVWHVCLCVILELYYAYISVFFSSLQNLPFIIPPLYFKFTISSFISYYCMHSHVHASIDKHTHTLTAGIHTCAYPQTHLCMHSQACTHVLALPNTQTHACTHTRMHASTHSYSHFECWLTGAGWPLCPPLLLPALSSDLKSKWTLIHLKGFKSCVIANFSSFGILVTWSVRQPIIFGLIAQYLGVYIYNLKEENKTNAWRHLI